MKGTKSFWVGVAIALGCLLITAIECRAVGQGAERISPQLALGRICASEIGLTGDPRECAAIASVLRRRAELNGWRFETAARLYSRRVFDQDREDDRAWVAFLREDGREPARWPTEVRVRRGGEDVVIPHGPWSAFRERWLTLYTETGRVLADEIESACAGGPVDHWGMRHGIDHERARRAGWIEAECVLGSRPCRAREEPTREDGQCDLLTRNAFWRIPDRGEDPEVDVD